jgi:hypothetical protein
MTLQTPGIVMLAAAVAALGFIVGGSWARRKETGAKDTATGIAFLLVGALAVGNLAVIGVKQRTYWATATVKIAQFEACDIAVLEAIKARDAVNASRNELVIKYVANPSNSVELLKALAAPLPPLPECVVQDGKRG